MKVLENYLLKNPNLFLNQNVKKPSEFSSSNLLGMESTQGDSSGISKNKNSLVLKRHDEHNLELKSLLFFEDQKVNASLDFYLYFPNNVHLKSCSKEEISSDFISRQRLFIPQNASLKIDEINSEIRKLETLILAQSDSESISSEIISTSQTIGAFLGELIKVQTSKIKKHFFVIRSRMRMPVGFQEDFNEITDHLKSVYELIQTIRDVTDKKEALANSVVQLMDEYVHHLFVESLSKIKEDLDYFKSINEDNKITDSDFTYCDELDSLLKEIQKTESVYQNKHNSSLSSLQEEDKSELLLVRLGQMKKFFQSKMFVQVAKKQTMKKLSEPAAAIAATFAALSAGVIQYFGSYKFVELSLGGLSLAMLGMALYVVRDRLKDLGRVYITNRISSVLPDLEYELEADSRKIGKIQEWSKVILPKETPESVQASRKSKAVSEAESFIAEDVIHMKRFYILNAVSKGKQSHYALQENLRVNIQRYLKFLDDPFKDIMLIDNEGFFSKIRSNKVYYFYAILDFKTLDEKKTKTLTHLSTVYRIVINKNGILKVIKC